MSFTLDDSLALIDTYKLQLTHPATGAKLWEDEDETKPVYIEIYGSSSKQYRNATTAMQNRALRRSSKKEQQTAELLKTESMGLLVACSVTSSLTHNGALVDNTDAFRALYSDPKYLWIKDQVDSALSETANFLAQ